MHETSFERSVNPWRFCVAPMMQYTDRHFRYFVRLLSRHARVYTEMVVADALLNGDRERFLKHSAEEAPAALQLGGSSPAKLAEAARIGAEYSYDEINLNVGCPSDRVKSGRFGASLMAHPMLVADCVAAMREAVDIPVTVKTRIGIDREDSYQALHHFVSTIAEAGCPTVIVHARKAWLDGLSPRENREIPPLRYDVVKQLKQDFPKLNIVVNGGITSIETAREHLDAVDGVMIGRAAYESPFVLDAVDTLLFNAPSGEHNRFTIFQRYLEYADREVRMGTFVRHLAKPVHYLFQGQPGAKQWRRHLSERCATSAAGIEALKSAVRCVERADVTAVA